MPTDQAPVPDTYARLLELLDRHGARYRLIEHPSEGRTEIVSALRGHDPRDAAKCMILMVKVGRRVTRHVLAVVPGNRRVSFDAIRALFGASYVSFASTDIAERLAGCVAGTVLPFAMNDELELIVDSSLTGSPEIYFNAARLDRSLALNTADYLAVAKPRIEHVCHEP